MQVLSIHSSSSSQKTALWKSKATHPITGTLMAAQAHGLFYDGRVGREKEELYKYRIVKRDEASKCWKSTQAQTCKAFISPIIIETKQLELDMSISMSFLNIYTKLLAT